MPAPPRPIAVDGAAVLSDPAALLRFPADRPAAALVSAGGRAGAAGVRNWCWLGEPVDEATLCAGDFSQREPPAQTLRRSLQPKGHAECRVGWLSYDLGACIEPAARAQGSGPAIDANTPLARFACLAPPRLSAASQSPLLRTYTLEPLLSETGAPAYCAAVRRAVRLIHEGDVFQINVAHRMRGGFRGSTRRLFVDLVHATAPARAAYLESPTEPGHVILSLSPELFLAVDGATGAVETRPIKGTLPADQPPDRLAASAKDAAELAMIVDLMRNDLGRVCSPGTIRVAEPRAIERVGGVHAGAGVWHGVATVRGRLAPGRDVCDLLAAAFPAGSITGAPKVRAMQRIDELEPFKRGPCFGAIGFLDEAGGAAFNVAIRTAVVRGEAQAGRFGEIDGALELCVGAGIVADSDPAAEWRETLLKAQAFTRLAGAACCDPLAPVAGAAP